MKDSEIFLYIKSKKDWNIIKTKKHELNYKIERNGNTLTLYFEDSNGKKDWKDNLFFLPVFVKAYKKCLNHLIVHVGFKNEYHSGNDQIMKELIDEYHNHQTDKVIIAGWSNGAAMSMLAAEDFFFRTGIKPTVVNFGCPMVCFDKLSAQYIKDCCEEVREYCNNNDVVTKVPLFFEHVNKIAVGDEYKFKKLFDPWNYHQAYGEVLGKMGL